jgi:excisionase family DNA binding protein
VPKFYHYSNIESIYYWRIFLGRGKSTGSNKKDIERIFLTFQEAQEYLNISHQTLYKLMKEGLASHKIGNKRVFLKEDLDNWIKTH